MNIYARILPRDCERSENWKIVLAVAGETPFYLYDDDNGDDDCCLVAAYAFVCVII